VKEARGIITATGMVRVRSVALVYIIIPWLIIFFTENLNYYQAEWTSIKNQEAMCVYKKLKSVACHLNPNCKPFSPVIESEVNP